jgi:ribosomal protein S10
MLFSVEEGLDLMDQQQVDQIIEELLEFADGARGHVASPGNLPSRTPWCVGLSSG